MIEVGNTYGSKGPKDEDVRIKVLSVENDGTIHAEVVELGNFYSSNRLKALRPGDSAGFVLGERLELERRVNDDGTNQWWIVKKPLHRPWHILSSEGVFEHYR